jgi:hypothetical protein
VDGAEIGIFEERDEVSLDGLLESTNSGRLETEITLEILSNFTNQSLERKLSDQKLSGLLISSNFTKSDSSWLISVWLLDTTGRWVGLSGSLGGESLTWGFATSRFSFLMLVLM